jgi:TRAP-type C4-dicarboxylate transport system substrate-binding protein
MMNRTIAVAALAAMAALTGVAPVSAQDGAPLKFATVSPVDGPLNMRLQHPWAARVNAHKEPSVMLDVRDGYALGNFGNIYDRVMNDIVQVASGTQGSTAGKFPLSGFVALPMLFDKPADASVAFWRIVKAGVLDPEYNEVEPLFVATMENNGLQFTRALDSPTELKGIKMAALSKVNGEVLETLGATPISMQLTEMYPSLQRHLVEGLSVAWTAFRPFKLGEVINAYVETKLGSAAAFIFMAKKRYEALPDSGKKVLMAESGENQSRAYGAYWTSLADEVRQEYAGKPGFKTVALTPAQNAAWQAKLQGVVDAWTAATPGGAKVLAEFKRTLAEVQAGR